MKTYRVAVIPGDGIGKEVVPEGISVLEAAAKCFGFAFDWHHFDWSCEAYVKTGRMMPEDGLDQLAQSQIVAGHASRRCEGAGLRAVGVVFAEAHDDEAGHRALLFEVPIFFQEGRCVNCCLRIAPINLAIKAVRAASIWPSNLERTPST